MQHASYVANRIKALRSNGRGPILFSIASGWFLSIGVRTVYPALLPFLRVSYELDLKRAGLLLSVLWVAYAFGQLPGGVLGDHIGEGSTMVISSILSAGTIFVVVISEIVPVLFGATILFGLGTALYGVNRFTALSDIYPEQTGTAIGVTMAAGDIGNSLLPPVASLLAAALAWQFGLGFVVPLFVLAAVALLVTVPGRTSQSVSAVNTLSIEMVRYIISQLDQPSIIRGTLILILGASALLAFTSFYPTYLVEVKGLSTTMAAGLFGLFFALGVVIKILSGWAFDQFGVRRSLPLVLGMAAVGLFVLPIVEAFWALVGVTALVSGLLGNGTIMFSYLTTELSSDVQGTGLGVLRTIIFAIGAVSPVLFGALADRGFFDEGFMMLGCLVILIVLITLFIPRN